MNIDLPKISTIPVINRVVWIAIIGVICVLVSFLLLTVFSYLWGKRRENLGRLPDDLKRSVQSELIEAVYIASQQKHTIVKLSGNLKTTILRKDTLSSKICSTSNYFSKLTIRTE